MPSSLIIRCAAYGALGGFPMDAAFRRISGENGAFSWTLREIFGNPRLNDAKRVRMHYHAGIHVERYFRIAVGLQQPDVADAAEASGSRSSCGAHRRRGRRVACGVVFLDTARAGVAQLRAAQIVS